MIILSPAFKEGDRIPAKFTCEGGDINPELHIQGVPDNAKSLALIMDDPDAPVGTWLHWTVWNINLKTAVIKEESVPPGSVEGITSSKDIGYGGPCPPASPKLQRGEPPGNPHRYYFRLYALDVMLDLKTGASRSELEQAMAGHIVAQAELMGTYGR